MGNVRLRLQYPQRSSRSLLIILAHYTQRLSTPQSSVLHERCSLMSAEIVSPQPSLLPKVPSTVCGKGSMKRFMFSTQGLMTADRHMKIKTEDYAFDLGAPVVSFDASSISLSLFTSSVSLVPRVLSPDIVHHLAEMSSPPSSPRHAAHRPDAVKRTYGSRSKRNAPTWTPNTIFSDPPSLSYGRTSSPDMSSSGYRIRTPDVELEEDEARTVTVDEEVEESCGILETNTKDNQPIDIKPVISRNSATTKSKKPPTTTVPAKQASLKSFFTFQSQPKSTKASASASAIRTESSTSANTTSTEDIASSSKTKSSLQQLHLVPVRHASSSSSQLQTKRPSLLTTCPKCNMSYIRGGTGGADDATHKAHCTRVTEGVKWDPRPASMSAAGSVTMTGAKLASWRAKRKAAGSCVVAQGMEFGRGKGKAKEESKGNVVCVEGYEASSDKRVRLLSQSFPLASR